ncbi:thermonuclease family protein [Paludifilum halophilum]|uniref:TNase-like domain-containing protein n=1 Tax=Paludifilum halophilum TaxID=1642702 RepID=A0A235B5M6_9BACL|nr:thermonuclease family protein [Paludifilum halophilum]OYD07603.1 hypothetical protein CHM34_08955 [Paludifilum halophilum]
MKKIMRMLLVLGLMLLNGCTDPEPPAPSPDPPKENPPDESKRHPSQIERVVDGDTVHLKDPVSGSTKVRMLSIDAPETNYRGKSQGAYGEASTRYLMNFLPEGTDVQVVLGREEKDDYGRLLAYLEIDGQDINEKMVRHGHAVPYFIYPHFDRFKRYRNALENARKEGRGMWDPENPIDELPFEFRMRIGNRKPDKYAGHFETKKYVKPANYKEIPLEQRVFFWNERDAQEAGYQKD